MDYKISLLYKLYYYDMLMRFLNFVKRKKKKDSFIQEMNPAPEIPIHNQSKNINLIVFILFYFIFEQPIYFI